MDPKTKEHLRRRIPFVILVGAVVWLGTEYLAAQPSAVEISYHYGNARSGLSEVDISYRQGEENLGRVRFAYHDKQAPKVQVHKGQFPDGHHEVLVELRYRELAPAAMKARAFAISSNGRVLKVKRPLIVLGESRVSIFIGDDDD